MILNHGVRGSIPTYNAETSYYGGSTPCVEIVTNVHKGNLIKVYKCVEISVNLQMGET